MASTNEERVETAVELVERLRSNGIPKHRNYSLQKQQDGGIESTIMKDAWQDAGIDDDNPGDADQYYFEAAQMLVIDLGNATPAPPED